MPHDKLLSGSVSAIWFDEYYKQFCEDPESLSSDWRNFFAGFEYATESTAMDGGSHWVSKEFKVAHLIDDYRKRGHLFTQTNPVRTPRKFSPTLDFVNYGLSNEDLDQEFEAGMLIGLGKSSLRHIIQKLQKTYCSNIGVEYMYIRNPEVVEWLTTYMETASNTPDFSVSVKTDIYKAIEKAVDFEQFIHRRFPGQKRFSLEGAEALVPGLQFLIDEAVLLGVEEIDFGMAHRGRLNVLTNIMQKPYENVFREFLAKEYSENDFLGDVKYHLGYQSCVTVQQKNIELNLLPNPSHLEAVGGVLQGFARGNADRKFGSDFNKVLPVLIHGDAAVAAQGVVYEVIQMSQLDGYKTGGTIHFVINNQIGFTTNYLDARSSIYSTDIGKVTRSPIFHVNSDDPEALVYVVQMAVRYRQRFHTDVFIDVLGYRKYGHNEGDEPRFTQPELYDAIAAHPNVKKIYAAQLVAENAFSQADIIQSEKVVVDTLDAAFTLAGSQNRVDFFKFNRDNQPVDNALKADTTRIKELAQQIFSLPADGGFIPKAYKIAEARLQRAADDKLDWSMCEMLAYAQVVTSGRNVRLSGQDSIRGTFSHRHSAFFINDTRNQYFPLNSITGYNDARFNVWNSLLSEYGVLGFEYGYALADRNALVIWEAQFGDFNNVAQVIIDQYISSAEAKWGVQNGVVLYLPHGYEGQGPEHSSARIERFLQLAVNGNMQVVQPVSPANLYHILLQQASNPVKPLVVFTPKSLLRHPAVTATFSELSDNTFRKLLVEYPTDPSLVKHLVLCSGKVYYDLKDKQKELNDTSRCIVAVEMLHPFPLKEIETVINSFENLAEVLWVQEEPINMGAAYYVVREMRDHKTRVAARPASSSPAVGLMEQHLRQQKKLIDKAFGFCNCVRRYDFCDMQCSNFDNHETHED